jgi:serine/threonine-protein kinase
MLVGQPFGPFVIDKEIGSGAMGAVYRGRYTKTGQVVAIKVMAPGLGTTNSRATERFEREAAILKQLKHPNIVRLFGVGKHQHTRYFAMEYVEGESLDKVMARRGRMSWEEVIVLGQQLCSALKHAHEKGIIHRDLKPSNLMVLPDGTLKLTDFGIAKDMDVTQLTSANCAVGTAAYMSPEQCKGERDLTSKSDLYSLGVVLYELITGRKPFTAENAMDMFMQHVSGTFERPSRIVLDLPMWLDILICQLLEKKPDQRPLDAAMVSTVLGSIKEKVEAQKSAGVEAAQRRVMDRLPGHAQADEQDRRAARFLLRGKVRKKGKKKLWYEQTWVPALGILCLLSLIVFTLYLVFRPPSAESLYEQAAQLMSTHQPEDEEKALAGPIKMYLDRYRRLDNAQTQQMLKWSDQADVREGEDLLRRYLKLQAKQIAMGVQNEDEKQAFELIDKESDGDVQAARQGWQKLGQEAQLRRWKLIAERHLDALDAQDAQEKKFREDLAATFQDGRERLPQEEDARNAFIALRYERFGDRKRAEVRWKELKIFTRNDPAKNLWFLLAARKVHDLKLQAEGGKDSQLIIEEKLKAAQADKDAVDLRKKEAYAAGLDIVALYGGDSEPEEIQKQVKEARKMLTDMAVSMDRKVPWNEGR